MNKIRTGVTTSPLEVVTAGITNTLTMAPGVTFPGPLTVTPSTVNARAITLGLTVV